jgi:hypothetical protein
MKVAKNTTLIIDEKYANFFVGVTLDTKYLPIVSKQLYIVKIVLRL